MNSVKEQPKQWKEGNTYLQWLLAIIANTTLMSYGLITGWVSPMTRLLQSELSPLGGPLSDNELSWMASSMCIAGAITVNIYAYIADKYGRKICILITGSLQAVGWIITMCAKSATCLIVARILCGLGYGGCFTIAPIYVKEISQDDIRGRLCSLMMLFYNVGTLLMYAVGSYLDYYSVLWIALSVPIATIVFMMMAPESPSYLVKIGEIDKATECLAILRGLDSDHKKIQEEINNLKNQDEYYNSQPDISFINILRNKPWRRVLLLGFSLVTVHAANGNYAIVAYASSILFSFNVTVSPELQSLSIPIFMIIGSLLSLICVEKLGRKALLCTALAVTVLAMLSIGTSLLLQDRGFSVPSWLPAIALITTVFVFALGASPVPYVVMAEMFNFQIRSKVMGYVVSYSWMVSFTLLATFKPIVNTLGIYSIFYVYAVINLYGLFVSLVILPETKGKSPEEIETQIGRICGQKTDKLEKI